DICALRSVTAAPLAGASSSAARAGESQSKPAVIRAVSFGARSRAAKAGIGNPSQIQGFGYQKARLAAKRQERHPSGRAFSSEVEAGSCEENASNQESGAPSRFNRNGAPG